MPCPTPGLGGMSPGSLFAAAQHPRPTMTKVAPPKAVPTSLHKLSIALKEMKESRGWLRFSVKSHLLPAGRITPLVDEAEQLAKILASSVMTAKGRSSPKRETSTGAQSNHHSSIPNS